MKAASDSGSPQVLRRVALGVAVAGLPLAFWPPGQNPYGPTKLMFVCAVGALAAVGLVLQPKSWEWLSSRSIRKLVLAVGVGLTAYELSVVFSADRSLSLMGAYPGYLGMLSIWSAVLVGIAAGAAARDGDGRLLSRTLVVSVAIVSAYALLQLVGADPFYLREGLNLARLRSTLGNPAFLGVFALLSAPLVARCAIADPSRGWRGWARVAAGGLVLCLAGSGSRAAWLGVVVAALVWAVNVSIGSPLARRVKLAVLALGGTAAVLAAGALIAPGAASRISEPLGAGSTAAWRIELWEGTLRMIGQRPVLGWGPDTFTSSAPRFLSGTLSPVGTGFETGSAHNLVLDVAAGSGIPAAVALLTAFALLLVGAYRYRAGRHAAKGKKHVEASKAEGFGAWAPLLAAGLAGGFVALQFGPASVDLLVLAAIDAGMLASLIAQRDGDSASTGLPSKALSAVLAVAAVLLAAGMVAGAGAFAADSIVGRLSTGGPYSWDELRAGFAKARALAPWEPVIPATEGSAALQAMLAGQTQAYSDGAEALAKARQLSPGSSSTMVLEGNLRLTAGSGGDVGAVEAALGSYRDALEADPDSPEALLGAGSAALALGETSQALTWLEQAVSIDPGSGAAWSALASAYEAMGRTEEAAEASEKAAAASR